LSDSFFFLSSYHESDDVVILSAAGAKDLLFGGARESRSLRYAQGRLFASRARLQKQVLRYARCARSAQDDTLLCCASGVLRGKGLESDD